MLERETFSKFCAKVLFFLSFWYSSLFMPKDIGLKATGDVFLKICLFFSQYLLREVAFTLSVNSAVSCPTELAICLLFAVVLALLEKVRDTKLSSKYINSVRVALLLLIMRPYGYILFEYS